MEVEERQPAVGSVEVVPGLHFTGNGVTVKAADHPSGLSIEVDVVPDRGRLIVDAVRASRREGGPAVTLAALRQVALQPFVKEALSMAYVRLAVRDAPYSLEDALQRQERGSVAWHMLDVEDRDRLRGAGPIDETLRWVALIYRTAVAIGEPPVKSVAGAFGVSLRTATNWVASARAAGHLEGES